MINNWKHNKRDIAPEILISWMTFLFQEKVRLFYGKVIIMNAKGI